MNAAEAAFRDLGGTHVTRPSRFVSVIVPCRNERRYIVQCLESILQNDYQGELEVLVVDGASDDGTRELLFECAQRSSRIRVLDNPSRITPAALNIAIRNSRGDVVVRMDAHCRYPVDYISSLVGWLEQSGADNVGGVWRTLPGAETAIARAIALALTHPFGVGNAHYRLGISEPKWVDTVPFGCYKRDVFERIGLFDEELVRNQDDELNQRVLRNGGRILLVPDVVIDYYARDSIGKVARMYYQYGFFKPLVAKKLRGIGTMRQVVPAALLLSLAISLALSPWMQLARWIFAGILGSYFTAVVIAIITLLPRNRMGVAALTGVVFPSLHFGYGWGSVRGLAHFFLRGLPATAKTKEIPLSR